MSTEDMVEQVRLSNEVIDELIQEELSEALAACSDIPSLRLAVGSLGARLRRCKPGSPKSQHYDARLTEVQNEAHEKMALIRGALRTAKERRSTK